MVTILEKTRVCGRRLKAVGACFAQVRAAQQSQGLDVLALALEEEPAADVAAVCWRAVRRLDKAGSDDVSGLGARQPLCRGTGIAKSAERMKFSLKKTMIRRIYWLNLKVKG